VSSSGYPVYAKDLHIDAFSLVCLTLNIYIGCMYIDTLEKRKQK
jgi:hypothetical protein